MADEENKEQTEEKKEGEEEQKSGSKKLIIIIAAAILVLGGGGAFFLMSGGEEEKKPSPESTAESSESTGDNKAAEGGEKTAEETKSEETMKTENNGEKSKEGETSVDSNTITFGETYALKPFHANLGNPLENRYLRLEIALEYKQGEAQLKELEARLPQIRDAVLSVASRKTREFLLGPDGKDQLRLEILNRINQYMQKKIESVFITDLLIE